MAKTNKEKTLDVLAKAKMLAAALINQLIQWNLMSAFAHEGDRFQTTDHPCQTKKNWQGRRGVSQQSKQGEL
eukprot:9331697-Prorocentrum_lima.AAC.1